MPNDFAPFKLSHHFLIAMPGLDDEVFARSVVYVCDHSENGAMGLVVNQPSELTLQALFERLDLPLDRADLHTTPVLQGGPVHPERGFVLHEPMGQGLQDEAGHAAPTVYAATLRLGQGVEMTTSRDVMEALSSGAGPRRVLMALGCASWSRGQLEAEVADNAWLTVPADVALLWDVPCHQRYDAALGLLGVSAAVLSAQAGRA